MGSDAPGRHVVLYDGVCGLCNGVVRFVLPRDAHATFRFAPLQGDWARAVLARHGEDAGDLDTFWVVRDAGTEREALLSRAEAVRFVVARLGFPWRLAAAIGVLPRPLLDRAYDLVARHRYRLFGHHDACVPPPECARDRFVQ